MGQKERRGTMRVLRLSDTIRLTAMIYHCPDEQGSSRRLLQFLSYDIIFLIVANDDDMVIFNDLEDIGHG